MIMLYKLYRGELYYMKETTATTSLLSIDSLFVALHTHECLFRSLQFFVWAFVGVIPSSLKSAKRRKVHSVSLETPKRPMCAIRLRLYCYTLYKNTVQLIHLCCTGYFARLFVRPWVSSCACHAFDEALQTVLL